MNTRILAIVSVLVFFGLAGYAVLFVKKRSLSLSDLKGTTQSEREARGKLSHIEVYRYTEGLLTGWGEANEAKLFDPNEIEVKGDLKAFQRRDQREEKMKAEEAKVFFIADQIASIVSGEAPLHYIEFRNDIRTSLDTSTVYTEEADYFHRSRSLSSQAPVRIESADRLLRADRGFEYQLDSERLRMFGNVSGSFTPSQQK